MCLRSSRVVIAACAFTSLTALPAARAFALWT